MADLMVSSGRLYRGERRKDSVVITVHQAPGSFRVLDDGQVDEMHGVADPYDRFGFDWGRATPGSERLAAALLRDALDGNVDPGLARLLVDEIMVGLPLQDPWVLWSTDIQDWAQRKVDGRPL